MKVYGLTISYFTRKLEAYLRYKEIPYELVFEFGEKLKRNTGANQVPAVELDDGRWMTDTTPIIAWLEEQHPEPRVIPEDPLQAFMSLLVEDYADEWLWRPAMHYRWSYATDRYHLSRKIINELAPEGGLANIARRAWVRRRQLRVFVTGDGIDAASRSHAEGSYLRILDIMTKLLERRPFLLGERPSLADIALMGPMFPHFGHDPTPTAIMKERAPAVFEWMARTWNARASSVNGPLEEGVPEDWTPLLQEACETNLVNLTQNAQAWKRGEKKHAATIQGTRYQGCVTSRYRVWCLERLRARYEALPEDAAAQARALLEKCGGWETLWQPGELGSGYDTEGLAPFGRGIEVVTEGRRV